MEPIQFFIDWKNVPAEQTFDQFLIGHNQELFHLLQSANHSSVGLLYLWGQKFCGKTHLLNSCFHAQMACRKRVFFLSLSEMDATSFNVAETLSAFDMLIVDDIDQIPNKDWELEFFNLINHTNFKHQSILFSAKQPPANIDLCFNDLRTRLSQGCVHYVHPPLSADRLAIMTRWVVQDQFSIEPKTLRYLINQVGGDMIDLYRIINQVKHQSMQYQRKITIELIKKIIAKHKKH